MAGAAGGRPAEAADASFLAHQELELAAAFADVQQIVAGLLGEGLEVPDGPRIRRENPEDLPGGHLLQE